MTLRRAEEAVMALTDVDLARLHAGRTPAQRAHLDRLAAHAVTRRRPSRAVRRGQRVVQAVLVWSTLIVLAGLAAARAWGP